MYVLDTNVLSEITKATPDLRLRHSWQPVRPVRIARERAGQPVAREDGMIAAIAKTAGAAVITRDQSGFAGCGVPTINPWLRAR